MLGITVLLSMLRSLAGGAPGEAIAHFATVTLTGCVAFHAIAFFMARSEKRRFAAYQAAEEVRTSQERYDNLQRDVRSTLEKSVSSAQSTLSDINKHIEYAEKKLVEANREFSDGVFAPFWDAIEDVANHLARSNAGINQIIEHSKTYRANVEKLKSEPPAFRIEIDALPDTSRVAEMMRILVRKAQKDFHFSTIYEQRKTNKLLITGFVNLAEALNHMGERIEESIDALSDSLADIAQTNRANTDELIASIQKLDERVASNATEQRHHEEKQREMLDNIQRKRKPRRVFPETFE